MFTTVYAQVCGWSLINGDLRLGERGQQQDIRSIKQIYDYIVSTHVGWSQVNCNIGSTKYQQEDRKLAIIIQLSGWSFINPSTTYVIFICSSLRN